MKMVYKWSFKRTYRSCGETEWKRQYGQISVSV